MQFILWGLFFLFFTAWRGPVGGLFILLLAWAGHRVWHYGWWSLRPGAALETYIYCQFVAMGLLAKSGGRVRESDIAAVEHFIAVLKLDHERRDFAVQAFTTGRRWQTGVRHAAVPRYFQRWRRLANRRHAASQAFLDSLVQIILRGKPPTQEQSQVLYQVADWIGAQPAQVEASLRNNRPTQPAPRAGGDKLWAYTELGLSEAVSDAEIKQAYRKLMKQYHPDKWAARQIDPVERHAAEEKVRTIRAAYDELKRSRGFR